MQVQLGWATIFLLSPQLGNVIDRLSREASIVKRALLHLAGVAVFTLVVNLIVVLVASLTSEASWRPATVHLFVAPLSWLITALSHSLIARITETEKRRLERLEVESELEHRRRAAQIARQRPSMFVAVLDELVALVRRDSQRATETVYALSSYLRAVIRGSRHTHQPIWAELEAVDAYLTLVEAITGKEVTLEIDSTMENLDARVRSLQFLDTFEELVPRLELPTRMVITPGEASVVVSVRGQALDRRIDLVEDRAEIRIEESVFEPPPPEPLPAELPLRFDRFGWRGLMLTVAAVTLFSLILNTVATVLLGDLTRIVEVPGVSLRWVLVGLFLYPVLVLAARWPVESRQTLWRLPFLGGALLASTTAAMLSYSWLFSVLMQRSEAWSGGTIVSVFLSSRNWLYSTCGLVAVGIVHAFHFWKKAQHEHQRTLELRRALDGARLDLLERSLHPHFLFNALNTALADIGEFPDEAMNCLVSLRQLLWSIQDRGPWTLRDEKELLEGFLRIEKRRFGPRLIYEVSSTTSEDVVIPRMIIQPIVENAVRHGMSSSGEPLAVSVTISSKREGELKITVFDDGVGFDSVAREGFGLSATRNRLRWFYGERAHIDMQSERGVGTSVSLTIPSEAVA